MTILIPEVSHGLPPRLGRGFAHRSRPSFHSAGIQRRNIGRYQCNLKTKWWFVQGGSNDFLSQMRVGQFKACEGETGRSGFQLSICLAVVIIEKASGETESLFVKG